jgi:ATP-dependent Clp protease adaptor protein ClpS
VHATPEPEHREVVAPLGAAASTFLRPWPSTARSVALRCSDGGSRSRMSTTAPVEVERPASDEDVTPDIPWIVIVWNDPINLMSYVVYVFQKLFGYPREKATKLMLDVHQKGRAVVSEGPREKCEFDVSRLHAHGLWATLQKAR